eukprot:g15572.t1
MFIPWQLWEAVSVPSNPRNLKAASEGEGRVAVCVDEGPLLPLVELGVLLAGMCIVPIDPCEPAGRFCSVVMDSEPTVIVAKDSATRSLIQQHLAEVVDLKLPKACHVVVAQELLQLEPKWTWSEVLSIHLFVQEFERVMATCIIFQLYIWRRSNQFVWWSKGTAPICRPQDCLERLGLLVREVPKLRVVLASSWRNDEALFMEALQQLASYQVVIHGTTPTSESRSRLDEICTWLEVNAKNVEAFVVLDDDQLLCGDVPGAAISHIFFTSGSTGRPKGCVVSHGALRSYCLAKTATYGVHETSVILVASAHTFDPSLGDFMSTWAAGGVVALGVALDAVTVGQQGVSWGFGIAKTATQMGFGAANAALRFTGDVGGPAAQVVTGSVEQVLNFAHGCTNLGQDLAHGITQASLSTAKFSLSAAGAQEGELLRLALGDEAAESIMMVLEMVRRFCTPLAGVSTSDLFLAAQAWAAVQQARRLEILQQGKRGLFGGHRSVGSAQVLDAQHAMALSNFTTSIILGDDLVSRLSLTTVQDLREACLRLNNPQAFELPVTLQTASVQAMATRGGEDDMARLAAAHTQIMAGAKGTENRLFPAGRLMFLRKAQIPSAESHYVALEGLGMILEAWAGHEALTLVNTYGVTECCVYNAFRLMHSEDLPSLVGLPLPGNQLLLLPQDPQGSKLNCDCFEPEIRHCAASLNQTLGPGCWQPTA